MDRSSLSLAVGLILLSVMAVGYAYYRSYVANDYIVEYQVVCDPESSACYKTCDENGECSYYQVMQKNASDLRRECGASIEECDASLTCLAADANCKAVDCVEDPALGVMCTASP